MECKFLLLVHRFLRPRRRRPPRSHGLPGRADALPPQAAQRGPHTSRPNTPSTPNRGHRPSDRRPGLRALRANGRGDKDCGRELSPLSQNGARWLRDPEKVLFLLSHDSVTMEEFDRLSAITAMGVLQVKLQRCTPLQAGGACEAPPHEDGCKSLIQSILYTHALYLRCRAAGYSNQIELNFLVSCQP